VIRSGGQGNGTPQISPLRSFGAPVEMTKGRLALPATVVAEQDPLFIALGGPLAHDSSSRDDKGERGCGPTLRSREGSAVCSPGASAAFGRENCYFPRSSNLAF
jgi:hypothetical protein